MNLDQIRSLAGLTSANNLLRQSNRRLWECCGAAHRQFSESVPTGIEVFCSTIPVEDTDKVVHPKHPRYATTTKALDVGLGNYLNIKLAHVVNHDQGRLYDIHGNATITASVNEDGPPVYHGYFNGVSGSLRIGWRDTNTFDAPFHRPTPANKEAFLSTIKAAKGFTSTWVISEGNVANYRSALLAMMKEFGWDQHLIYESPLFNNRVHEYHDDCLRLFVYQIKED